MDAVMVEIPASLGGEKDKRLYPSIPAKKIIPSVERKVADGIANAKYNYEQVMREKKRI